jgi:hypothetical protein
MKRFTKLWVLLIISLMGMAVFFAGCKEETEFELTPDRDVAETLAGSIAMSTGGALDQLSDLCDLLYTPSTEALEGKYPKTHYFMNKTFNSINGTWTIHLERERGNPGETPYAVMTRDYTLQYLDSAGIPQQYYITTDDTARTVNFSIKGGTGQHVTRRISQQLNAISGSWTVTNAHLPLVTINGSYTRAAVDTITGWNRTRISDHTLNLTFTDIVAPRGYQSAYPYFYQAVSGNMSGTFDADITFIQGDAYNETSVHRSFSIDFGNGSGDIQIGSEHYRANLYSGEILD